MWREEPWGVQGVLGREKKKHYMTKDTIRKNRTYEMEEIPI